MGETATAAQPQPSSQVGAALFLVDVREAALSTKQRKALPKSAYVFPDKAPDSGSYPIPDEAHGKDALARSSGKSEEAAVKAAVYKKFPKLKPSSESKKAKEAEAGLAARLAAARTVRLRESAFPLVASYDLAALMRGAGTVWADAQATGSADDEADAQTLAKTVKRVIERHPEIVQIGSGCGCGPVCCC